LNIKNNENDLNANCNLNMKYMNMNKWSSLWATVKPKYQFVGTGL